MPATLTNSSLRAAALPPRHRPLLAAGGFALLASACCPAAMQLPEPGPPQPTPREVSRLEPAPVEASAEVLPETGARHEINPFTSELTVKVGDLVTHTLARHPSVGRDGVANVSGEAVVLLRQDVVMKHPERQGMPGGDASSTTWVFKAVAPGAAAIRIEHLFRGEVEHRIEVALTVE